MTGSAVIGGKYELVRQLGMGVLGSVWEAAERSSGAHVALKLMSCPSDALCERILDEARIAKDVSYPSLVAIVDVGEAQERQPYVAMELCLGETLADRLAREKKLGQKLVAEIGRNIAGALTTAHNARLVHGDLRPANIFLVGEPGTNEPIVKVLDLWMARSLGPEHADMLVVTAPGYRAPEQVASRQTPDVRSDLWTLGVLLFEMATGRSPYGEAKRRADVDEAILRAPIPRLSSLAPDLDPALDEIVSRCLERDRDKRIGSAMVVTHMLNAIAMPKTPAPQPVGASKLGSTSGARGRLLGSATEVVAQPEAPRGQLGTLVMAPEDPLPPIRATRDSGPASDPSAGPLGTMVMSPGSGPSLPSPRSEPSLLSHAAPSPPREQLATQVLAESFDLPTREPVAPRQAAHPHAQPHAPQPGLSTLMSARTPQATSPALPVGPTDAQRILIIAVVVSILVLVALVVVFVVL